MLILRLFHPFGISITRGFTNGILTKHTARLCAHGGIQQRGVNYCRTYAPSGNGIHYYLW